MKKNNNVFIISENDPYHQLEIDLIASTTNSQIEHYEGKPEVLAKLKYKELNYSDNAKICMIKIADSTNAILEDYKKINITNRIIVLVCKNKADLAFAKRIAISKHEVYGEALKRVVTWKDKYEANLRMSENMGVYVTDYANNEVRKLLMKLLIREPELWYDVSVMVKLYKGQHKKIDMPFLESVFENVDFYSLDEWIEDVLKGTTKLKTFKFANYFINKKQYNVNWLLEKIRETILNLTIMHEARIKGVIYDGTESANTLIERSDFVKYKGKLKLLELKESERKKLIRLLDDLPYKYILRLQTVFFRDEKYINSTWELYEYLEEVKVLREKFNTDYPKTVKTFKRK